MLPPDRWGEDLGATHDGPSQLRLFAPDLSRAVDVPSLPVLTPHAVRDSRV